MLLLAFAIDILAKPKTGPRAKINVKVAVIGAVRAIVRTFVKRTFCGTKRDINCIDRFKLCGIKINTIFKVFL